jgi:hypothetical protein
MIGRKTGDSDSFICSIEIALLILIECDEELWKDTKRKVSDVLRTSFRSQKRDVMVPIATRSGRRVRPRSIPKRQIPFGLDSLHGTVSLPTPRSMHMDETLEDHARHPAGDAVCPRCQAVYHGKRWSYLRGSNKSRTRAPRTECPGCRLEREGKVGGIIRLSGNFLSHHLENVWSQIRRIALREQHRNPMARLLRQERSAEGFSIYTTHHTLAILLGKELHHANRGSLKIHWSDHDPLLVDWSRD